MNRWLHIIVSLFLALGVATMPMAHAAELSFGTGTVASVDSFPGFSKKSNDKQSDPAKASVTFHGCHVHHIGIPVGASQTPELVIAVKAVTARNGADTAPQVQTNTFSPTLAPQPKHRTAETGGPLGFSRNL